MTTPPTLLDQVEDAVLKIAPVVGGVFGGVIGAAYLEANIGVLVAFLLGGVAGMVAPYLFLRMLFRVLNPRRDCRPPPQD